MGMSATWTGAKKGCVDSLIEAVYFCTVAKRVSMMLVTFTSERSSIATDSAGMAVGAAMAPENRADRARTEKNEVLMFAS